MNESLFNDASPTNLHVVTSIAHIHLQLPLNSDKFNLLLRNIVVFNVPVLYTDQMQLYTLSEKVHPLTFDGKLL